MIKKILLATILTGAVYSSHAQDTTLLHWLEDSVIMMDNGKVTGTFKATQLINTPTIEAPAKQSLQFMIMHRFGRINEGAYALFGLDNASIRFALDYGLTTRLSIGVGRSSFDKVYDASFKWAVMQQIEKRHPFSVSLYGLIAHTTLRYADKPYLNARLRTMYTTQLLMAKKFTSRFSLQVVPSWVHFNLVPTPMDKNDLFALGIGGRLKVAKRISINGEFNLLPANQVVSTDVYHSAALGLDIETGGHVFQLLITNAQGMIAPYYLAKTTGRWGAGDIYFGFNVTRLFTLKK